MEENGPFGSTRSDGASFFKATELSPSPSESQADVVYEGPVYHLGVNRIGHHFCHRRYLRICGTYVQMYKKEPGNGDRPIRQGVISKFLKIEDMGRRKFEDEDLYVLKISNTLDGTTKGEIACKTALDASSWKNAFLQAKEEASARFSEGSGHMLESDGQFDLSGHRPRLRRYAQGLTRLIKIGRESEHFLRGDSLKGLSTDFKKGDDDIRDQQDWRCVRCVNGIRILEDVTSESNQKDKVLVLKSVGVVAASTSDVFEMLIDIHNPHRKQWDILTGDLELIEEVDGHHVILHGTFDPKYVRRWNSKRDFVFSQFWRHDPDNSYMIFQYPSFHKRCPKRPGYRRIQLNTTTWEIKPLPYNRPNSSSCVVTQTMEIRSTGWGKWRKKYFAKLDKTMPYIVLCQIAGLRDYFAASTTHIEHTVNIPTVRNDIIVRTSNEISEDDVTHDEFYDAIAGDVEGDDDEDIDEEIKSQKVRTHRFQSIALGLSAFVLPGSRKTELVNGPSTIEINPSHFEGSLLPASDGKSSNCWSDPGGGEFMVRGKTYFKDDIKVSGGDPLLKLVAVDWFKAENRIDSVAANKNSLVQSDAAQKLPFLLIINLQVPSTPNYSLVFYFGAPREIRKGSLLDRFVNGSDTFRDSRFKLIPQIVEGYWFVKRAVGTKACLLGKAVNCQYIRNNNYLEIDVDIGSSSVARSIIGLVLGHITNLVVDMAILIEGRAETELPEYLLGTMRVNRVDLDSAKQYD